MKKYITMLVLAVCSIIYILLPFSVLAQTPETLPSPGGSTGTHELFSPSITSFYDASGGKVLAVAYSYVTNSTPTNTRSVAVATSTDEGSSWTTHALSMPKWDIQANPSSTDALDNMDDPQIISTGDQNLFLVVRAWSKSTGVIGAAFQEQTHSIFKKVGIYICFSTDGGSTWGHYD